MNAIFTLPGVWSGGFYEMTLFLGRPSAEGISEALTALWSSTRLKGPFLSRDVEPEEQERTEAVLHGDGHLYGVAGFQGFELPYGTYSLRENDESGRPLADFVSLYLPLSAIGRHFAVGGYPFADHAEAESWRAEIDGWFLNLLRGLTSRFHFDVGVIGWEPEFTAGTWKR